MGCTMSPKFIHQSLDLQQVRMRLCLQTGPLKKQHDTVKVRVGPNPVWLVSLWEEEIWTHTRDVWSQKKDQARTQQEGHHRQTKVRVLRRNQTCSHLGLQPPELCPWYSPEGTPGADMRETKFCCWSHQPVAFHFSSSSITVISRRI